MKSHICTCCKKRRQENKMKLVYYSLFQNHFWHCMECLSTAENIDYFKLCGSKNRVMKTLTHQQIRNNISNNIRRLIKEKNTNSTKLAELLNMARSNFHYQIRPDTNTSITSIINIGNALEVDFKRFFYDYRVNRGIEEKFILTEPQQIIVKMSKNIMSLIKKKNLTKAQLARELNMSETNLGYKISSKNNIRINSLLDIARGLGVDFVKFFK